ncbi:ferritin-like domain-containing protein [Pedobacter nyackensis]|uniref:Ferritin-like n=1 Tax=Pedobacter nyackensis TaxID=475255 RepID=A0A1W2EFC5_9SPHI|nr:ferritin-like domain-containing protein [Pedobacter nyackensis]SMD08409.1 Ferritin-like [Pedobacter nyackensis]
MTRFKFQFETEETILPKINHSFTDFKSTLTKENLVAFSTIGVKAVILKRQKPAMELVDELIFLLHTAAEIEHSLMVQYLYSVFSLPTTSPHSEWRNEIMTIAREEMGHLMAVQNILIAVGGALNFEREDYPYNDIYPFHFRLEPFSISALAKYVLAEMPAPDQIPAGLGFNLETVKQDAKVEAPDESIQRVGALFNLLTDLASQLKTENIFAHSENRQADPEVWTGGGIHQLIMSKVTQLNGQNGLIDLIKAIGLQGEGSEESPENDPSHFLRFFRLYQAAKNYAAQNGEASLARSVPVNPTVSNADSPSYLENNDAYKWGVIFNHRYRWLLLNIHHHLLAAPGSRERTQLSRWAFADMRFLSTISALLTDLPQHSSPQTDALGRLKVAAAPFELPYSLNLPANASELWNYHKRFAAHSTEQLNSTNLNTPFITELKTNNQTRLTFINLINP